MPPSMLSLSRPEELSLTAIVLNLFLSGLVSYVLSLYYIKHGRSLSNRTSLAKDFTLIALTTTLIISVVKSSLALSLGLVGALSIVRFRAAIKEPEELAYLFLTIAIGLGFGADQRVPTLLAFALILLFVHVRNRALAGSTPSNLYVNFETASAVDDDLLDRVISTAADHAEAVDLRRLDRSNGSLQVSFLVTLPDGGRMTDLVNALCGIAPDAEVTFVDQSRHCDS